MTRGATLFSGGGGVEALLKRSINFVHAVEYDPAIAAVYRANHGDHVQVASVCNVDYSLWGALDYLHASPVCKEFSQAKTGGQESDNDIQTALAVVRCLEETQPQVFTLENVGGYQHSQSYCLICRALDQLGYMWYAEVLNSADFGVPQTRRRLILRAVKDALLPGLAAPDPWVGWYAAIEDLIPGLPDSQFAPWQLARLPEELQTFYINGSGNTNFIEAEPGKGCLVCASPAHTITTISQNGGGWPKAFVVAGNGNQLGAADGGSVTVRDAAAPYFTITAAIGKVPGRAFLMRSSNTQQEWGDGMRHAVAPAYTVATDSPPRAWLVDCQHTNPSRTEGECRGVNIRDIDASAQTMLASRSPASYKALLINGDNASRDLTIRNDDSPCWTGESSTAKAPVRAWLSQGRVVKMTPRALARFQSLPDSYVLPEKSGLACTIIGNCVPSLMMQKIVEPLL